MADAARSSSRNASPALSVKSNGSANPFRMAPDNDIFSLRDREKQDKLKQRLELKKLKIWQKGTAKTNVGGKPNLRLRVKSANGNDELEAEDEKTLTEKRDQEFTITITRNRYSDKEPLNEYINKKREMFLVQYSLGVKRDEMRKLEEIAAAEERKLELAEQYLEEDAALFDEFLKENDRNASDAIKIADAETRAKLEKVAEIKRISAQIMTIKSEISKYEDTLKEYQMYKKFLTSVTPKDWLDERAIKRQLNRKTKFKDAQARSSNTESTSSDVASDSSSSNLKSTKNNTTVQVKSPSQVSLAEHNEDEDIDEEDEEEEHELYFTDPQQLLDIFAELEEQNLSLIQNSQETEEALEEMKQTVKNTQAKMEKETAILKDQIEKLNNAILKEEEKTIDLEAKAKMFSFGEFKADDQEKMLAVLHKKVEEVYQSCIGENEASLSTLQMLTNIENRLEELFEQIEMLPADKVEAAEKAKERERRMRLREEKLELQKRQQEERLKRALERAKAEPKKKFGRRLVPRSEPPQPKIVFDESAELASREEEELAYYFMP